MTSTASGADGCETGEQALLGNVLAESGVRQQLILDDVTYGRWLVRKRTLVEVAEDAGVRARQEIKGNLAASLRNPGIVELSANEAQQRRLDFGVGKLGATCDEAHDRCRNFLRDQALAGLHDRGERLLAGHARQPQAILRDARHANLQPLKRGEVVLAQRNQHPIVAARKIEVLRGRLVRLNLRLEVLGRAILNEVGEIRDEACGPCPPKIIRLRKRKDLFELIEYQQRNKSRAGLIAQDIVAMMQKFPQRLALDRDAYLGPLTRAARRLSDRLFDLHGRLRSLARVIDAHIDRAVALRAQARDEAGAQDGSFAEARLAEEHGQEFALHPARKFRDLILAPVEVGARLFRE